MTGSHRLQISFRHRTVSSCFVVTHLASRKYLQADAVILGNTYIEEPRQSLGTLYSILTPQNTAEYNLTQVVTDNTWRSALPISALSNR
jgi:hypothetical protein